MRHLLAEASLRFLRDKGFIPAGLAAARIEGGAALNNILSTTVGLVNSLQLNVPGAGAGTLDERPVGTTPVLDLYIAPVQLDLLVRGDLGRGQSAE